MVKLGTVVCLENAGCLIRKRWVFY